MLRVVCLFYLKWFSRAMNTGPQFNNQSHVDLAAATVVEPIKKFNLATNVVLCALTHSRKCLTHDEQQF